VADGVSGTTVARFAKALAAEGAGMKIVALKVGGFISAEGAVVAAHEMVQGAPSVLFDAVIILGGDAPPAEFLRDGAAQNFAGDAFKHLKAIACDAGGAALLAKAGISADSFDAGVIELGTAKGGGMTAFIEAAKQHRIWDREAGVKAVA
jgi:catalase